MEAPLEPPATLGLAAGRSLVQVVCAKGRLLAAKPDHALSFVNSGAEGATALWVLAALADHAGAAAGAAGRYVLQSAAGAGYLSAAGDQLRCSSEPTMLQIYMDMNRGAVLGSAPFLNCQSGHMRPGRLAELPAEHPHRPVQGMLVKRQFYA